MLVFLRAKRLTEYVVHKHLKMEPLERNASAVGDKLYDICMEVLSINRSTLEELLLDVVFKGNNKENYPITFFSLMKRVRTFLS